MTVARGSPGADYALETEKISKHFAAVTAVDQLSISVLRGKITSIVGPNGSGKSTLVNLLSGILPLDGGIVIIEGARFSVVRAHETPDHGITRTFQEVRLFDQITVWDNIMVTLTQRKPLPCHVGAHQAQPHREGAGDPGDRRHVGEAPFSGHGPLLRPA